MNKLVSRRGRGSWCALALGGLCMVAAVGCGGEGSAKDAQRAAAVHQPTPAEAAAFAAKLAPMVSRSPANVRVVTLKDGTVRADFQSGYQNVVIARTNANGTVSRTCVDSEEQATAFMLARTPSAARGTHAEAR
jgi:hypothetical protein